MPTYVYPSYSSNSSHAHTWSSSATTYTMAYNGPPQTVTFTPAVTPSAPQTETDRLLADVESVCALAR